ncbi:hypothetical protein CC86DRAFT_159963 [Ophiobolus disseminans]|uniref:Protein kinase domain-containing protein n=1 Tax=Ophiobolus disseminans TaxID=1469910 RepID=A0A6A7ACL2_9PLEO|nr:hypothetical protein CC86DRAFT_159963 [Ophiobolus disseminans]
MTDTAMDDLDKALGAWFPPGRPIQTAFSENDIRDISEVLRRYEKLTWSKIPRIYITLRLIDRLAAIDIFLSATITDVSFPFSQRILPEALKGQDARSDFLEKQTGKLSKALNLKKEDSRHRHLASPADTPFEKIAELGKGAHGYVDQVRSNVSYREYARNLIPRGRTFRKDKAVLRDFERELATLKKLSHPHIVELIGSYTELKYA